MNKLQRTVLQGFALTLMMTGRAHADEARELTWDDLMPEGEIPQMPELPPNHDLMDDEMAIGDAWEDSSFEDAMSTPAYPTGVVEELNGTMAKLPGFIVPLELTEGAKVSEFLLVPYFGACIHYPPPPPNQIVYITPKEPVSLQLTSVPVWVTGELVTEFKNSGYGAAGYTMAADIVEEYLY